MKIFLRYIIFEFTVCFLLYLLLIFINKYCFYVFFEIEEKIIKKKNKKKFNNRNLGLQSIDFI